MTHAMSEVLMFCITESLLGEKHRKTIKTLSETLFLVFWTPEEKHFLMIHLSLREIKRIINKTGNQEFQMHSALSCSQPHM